MLGDCYGEDAHETWIEKFCLNTNPAFTARDEQAVRTHLAFMSEQLHSSDESGRLAINVSFAENLMWNRDSKAKRWAWRARRERKFDVLVFRPQPRF